MKVKISTTHNSHLLKSEDSNAKEEKIKFLINTLK